MEITDYCYYIGIDIDDRNAVISFYQTGMKEPETVSTVAGSEIFQIPLVLTKKKGLGQWFIGEEAEKMALVQNEPAIDQLITRTLNHETIFVEDEKYEAEELLTLYMKKLILLASRLGNPRKPDRVVITVEKLSREITTIFQKIGSRLEIEKDRLTLLDRAEGFYYFALNQKSELWLHDVFLFDYRSEDMKCCCMNRNLKTSPQVVTISSEVRKIDQNNRDDHFYRILQECFRGHIISSVYLVGDGFEGNWMKMSLAYMCKGRHAFIGKNLYSKGACYAALMREKKEPWPYIYMGDNEMKVNVSLKVRNHGKMEFFTLINAGENCYETSGECEVILDGTAEIDFWLQLPHSREAKIEKLELADLPPRENKTTRLRIVAKPLSDSKVQVVIRDMGFGELVKSSDKSWEYTMSL